MPRAFPRMKTSTNADPGKMGSHKPINEMLDLISVKLHVKIVGSAAQNSADFCLKTAKLD